MSDKIGKFVIVRCRDAGVHAGVLVSANDRSVSLEASRRLWLWRVPMGAPSFLSGVAIDGLDHAESKVGTPIDVDLLEACEIILCTDKAEQSIRTAPEVPRTV